MCGPGHGALLLDTITKAGAGGIAGMPGGLTYKVKEDKRSGNLVLDNLPALLGT